MGIKKFIALSMSISLLLLTLGCTGKKSKSDIEIEFVQDTINLGYTYWWPESGPFIGQCGEELSFVFSGTLVDLKSPTAIAGPLYNSQIGTIEIEQVFKIKDLNENKYANQKFITTDCFEGLNLNIGDQLLVFCFDYENSYTIPGSNSILKISDFDDPVIASVKKYIDAGQNPLKIKKDVGLWATKGLGRKLQEIIKCAQTMNPEISTKSIGNQ